MSHFIRTIVDTTHTPAARRAIWLAAALLLSVALFTLTAPAETAYARPPAPGEAPIGGTELSGLGLGAQDAGVCANHTWVDPDGGAIEVQLNKGSSTLTYPTALARLTFDDGKVAYAFCTDISHRLGFNQRVCLDSGFFSDWRVAWLVTNYPPTLTDRIQQAARQAAVWYLTDGYALTANNPDAVKSAYNSILASIPASMPPEYQPGNVDMTIDPASDTNFLPGQEVHPFTVRLTKGGLPLVAYTINVTKNLGALDKNSGVTDANGEVNFTLTHNIAGTASITATAVVTLPAGSRFVHATDPLEAQRLVLGESQQVTVQALASKTWLTATNLVIAHKFEDRNYNGVQDAGEPDLKDWQFTLKVPGGATTNGTTDASGMAYFYDKVLATGTYTLTETLLSNWTNSTALSQTCTRSGGADCKTWVAHFGNAQYSVIEIIKFHDLNGNGVWDQPGEPTLPGWQFDLRKGGAAYLGGTTGPDGRLTFTDLDSGNYTVIEHLLPGYTNTTPLSQDVVLGYPDKKTVKFGNRRLGSLQVTKIVNWNGVPADRDQDFEICITGPSYPSPNANCRVLVNAYNGGVITWTNLIPGPYVVTEKTPAPTGGWAVQIVPAQVTVPDGGLATATVTNSRKPPKLELDKAVVGDGNAVGNVITFTIRITNTGPTALKMIPLTDVFTGPVVFLRSEPPQDTAAGNHITWNNLVAKFGGTPLDPGDSFLVTVVFGVDTGEDEAFNMDNTAVVNGARDTFDTPANRADDTVQLSGFTAVTLLYFIADPAPGGVQLSWATQTEFNNYGFRLLRSTTGLLMDAVRLPAFIPGTGHGQHNGASYAFLDSNVQPGQSYTYWLMDVDLDGTETIHPETSATSAAGSRRIYLPVVTNQ